MLLVAALAVDAERRKAELRVPTRRFLQGQRGEFFLEVSGFRFQGLGFRV